ncbi:MAG: asparagine synthase (glutamine-hydrolyzing) [Acidobacteria bacterium]|nr:MAG: asparagine synthase (glutamine-hydrolyzing) [Acidobacteriota bacterium]
MCGICGIVWTEHEPPPDERLLAAMRDTMVHRGPDDAGGYIASGVAFASRRLAILDLSARGHMPMTTAERRYWITYNGEIYNFQELRSELEARGCSFQSNCDTEVLLRMYERHGAGMLPRLNGMFAFAIWDERCRTLFLARDRMGVKPLYYATRTGALHFASEQKALFASGIDAAFDQKAWEELLCFRYVAGERTPFVGVTRLLPGHFLTWCNGDIRIQRWWNLRERALDRRTVSVHPTEWFRETFDSAVDLRRISDVPLGVLLSGGIDSGSVAAALALRAGAGVSSFTVRFAERAFDEGAVAHRVVDRWKLQPHELVIEPSELLDRIERSSWVNDEPLAHASDVHLLALAEYAKARVTVLLSGEGADELLGGYVRYRPLMYPHLLMLARPFVTMSRLVPHGRRLGKLADFLSLGSLRDFVLFNACEVLPGELKQLGVTPTDEFPFRQQVLQEAESLYPGELARQAMYSDQHTFLCSLLDRNDRMTMGASIECRTPFLDYRLVEGIAGLPSRHLFGRGQSKHLLRQAIGHRLPDAVLKQRKWGFAVPWHRYLREVPSLAAMVTRLPVHDMIREGPFREREVRNVVQRFISGDDSCGPLVRQLTMVTAWHDAYFKQLRTRMMLRRVPLTTAVEATDRYLPIVATLSAHVH